MAVTIESLRKLWKKQFILDVRREITVEIEGLKSNMAALQKKFDDTEMNIRLSEDDISVAHSLPPTNKTNDRLITKFVRRAKCDEIYKKKVKLRTKRAKGLSTIGTQSEVSSINCTEQIHVNESLTPYRKRLFGRILDCKRSNY